MTEEIFRADAYARRCEAAVAASEASGVVLDRTVFYARGGGQPGDRGSLVLEDGTRLEVVDTIKGAEAGAILHQLVEGVRQPPGGAKVAAEIDWRRRHRLMRMHSAMHLLCAAIACPVTGGQVGDAKSRLDFDLQGGSVDKDEVGEKIERWIAEDRPIRASWIETGELEARPDLVRTMSVRPPTASGRVRLIEIEGVDLQACGGTHVRSTGEIGAVQVGKLENKGRQNRRISLTLID
jgi:misacylated tRNA(Ala) deacylase